MATPHDRSNSEQDAQWEPCGGEISQMVSRLDRVERGKRTRQLASTAMLSLVIFATGAIVVGGFLAFREPQFGGIGCTECLAHAAEYRDHVAGVAPMSDLQLAGKMKIHLEQCPCCRTKFGEAYPDITLANSSLGIENPLLRLDRFSFALASTSPRY